MSDPNDYGWHTSDSNCTVTGTISSGMADTTATATLYVENIVFCPLKGDYIPRRCCPNFCKAKTMSGVCTE